MLQKTINRKIQAVMNNLKFNKFGLLSCEQIWDSGLMQRFLRLVHKQWLRPVPD